MSLILRRSTEQVVKHQHGCLLPKGPCTCPHENHSGGRSPEQIQIDINRINGRQTTRVRQGPISDAENSTSSSSSSHRPRHPPPRRARRKPKKERKSSDEFLSLRETSKSGSKSTAQRTFRSYNYISDSSARPCQRVQTAVASKSADTPIPVITVTRTDTETARGRGKKRRSRSTEIRIEVPPPADAPAASRPCCHSQRKRVTEAPCYPSEPAAYHPSCDSVASESSHRSNRSCTSKVPKNTTVYCPEPHDSTDYTRPECWTGVSRRLLEDQQSRPQPPPVCPKESTLNVTITTNMQGSKIPHPQRKRRSSADHHEHLLNHLNILTRRHNPMDESQNDIDRNDHFGYGQRREEQDDNEALVARNRNRRESLQPPEPDDDGPGQTRDPTRVPTAAPSRAQQNLSRHPSIPQSPPLIPPRPPARSFDSGIAEPSVSDYNIRLTQTQESTEDAEDHAFPFQETPSGNVKFDKRLVSFENPKIAVLVSHPEKTQVKIRQDRHGPNLSCRRPSEPEPEPDPVCKPPVIWDEPRFQNLQDEDQPSCSISGLEKTKSAPIDVQATCYVEPPKDSPGLGCSARACRVRSRSTDGNRRHSHSLAYGSECTRASRDFMENIHHRLKTAHNPDTKIRIGCNEFPCHALALECYSKYFDRMKRPKEAIMEVEIPECVISAKYFPNLMDWILIDDKDKLLVVDRENAVHLFSAAAYLGIPDLRKDVLEFVKMKIESCDPSIMKMYGEAREKQHCEELISLLAQKLSTLFPQIYKTKQFLNMDVKELTMILNADNIVIKSEMDVFDSAVRWLLYDWDRRRRYTQPVMRSVRFGLMSSLQLTQVKHPGVNNQIPAYAELISDEEVNKLMDDGLTFAILRESYKGRSGELNMWVKKTGIEAPRFRHNLSLEPDDNRLPAAVTFESEHDDETPVRRSSLKPRDPSPSPRPAPPPRRGRQTSITEDVTERSIKRLGEDNVGVSRFARSHSHDYQEEDARRYQGQRRTSWRDPANSTADSNLGNRGLSGVEDGEWMDAEYGHDEVDAAVLIQSRYRGYLARKRFAALKRSAHAIQAAYRAKARSEDARSRKSARKSTPDVTVSAVRKLTLPDSDAVIIFGGSNPNLPFGDDNNAQEIYQLNPLSNQWKFVGLLPQPRIRAGAVHLSGIITIFGGSDPRYMSEDDKPRPSANTWSLNVETGKWKQLANMVEARTNFGYAALNGKIFVFGGTNADGHALDSCESYDPQYNSWNIITSMDGPRVSMAVAQVGDKIWIAGGLTKNPRLPMLKSVIVYDVKGNRFFSAPSLPHPTCFATMTSYYDRVFIFAGASKPSKGGTSRSVSEVLVLENGEWQVFGNLKMPRHGQCQVKLGKYVLIIGGVTSDTKQVLNTVESFNMEKGTASTKVASMPKQLSGMAGIVLH